MKDYIPAMVTIHFVGTNQVDIESVAMWNAGIFRAIHATPYPSYATLAGQRISKVFQGDVQLYEDGCSAYMGMTR